MAFKHPCIETKLSIEKLHGGRGMESLSLGEKTWERNINTILGWAWRDRRLVLMQDRKLWSVLNIKFILSWTWNLDSQCQGQQMLTTNCTSWMTAHVAFIVECLPHPETHPPARHTHKRTVTLNIMWNNWTEKWFCVPLSPNDLVCS